MWSFRSMVHREKKGGVVGYEAVVVRFVPLDALALSWSAHIPGPFRKEQTSRPSMNLSERCKDGVVKADVWPHCPQTY